MAAKKPAQPATDSSLEDLEVMKTPPPDPRDPDDKAKQTDEQLAVMDDADAALVAEAANFERDMLQVSEGKLDIRDLEARPQETASSFVRLFRQYASASSKLKAMEAERPGLLRDAARTTVVDRRLNHIVSDTASVWVEIAGASIGDAKTYAWSAKGHNKPGPVTLVMVADGKLVGTIHHEHGCVSSRDGINTFAAS